MDHDAFDFHGSEEDRRGIPSDDETPEATTKEKKANGSRRAKTPDKRGSPRLSAGSKRKATPTAHDQQKKPPTTLPSKQSSTIGVDGINRRPDGSRSAVQYPKPATHVHEDKTRSTKTTNEALQKEMAKTIFDLSRQNKLLQQQQKTAGKKKTAEEAQEDAENDAEDEARQKKKATPTLQEQSALAATMAAVLQLASYALVDVPNMSTRGLWLKELKTQVEKFPAFANDIVRMALAKINDNDLRTALTNEWQVRPEDSTADEALDAWLHILCPMTAYRAYAQLAQLTQQSTTVADFTRKFNEAILLVQAKYRDEGTPLMDSTHIKHMYLTKLNTSTNDMRSRVPQLLNMNLAPLQRDLIESDEKNAQAREKPNITERLGSRICDVCGMTHRSGPCHHINRTICSACNKRHTGPCASEREREREKNNYGHYPNRTDRGRFK